MIDYGKVVADRDAAIARVAELEAQPPQEVTVVSAEPSEEQVADIRKSAKAEALAEADARHAAEMEQLEADFGARLEAARSEGKQEQADLDKAKIDKTIQKHEEEMTKAELTIKKLKAQADIHNQRITYALEAISRAMSEIDNEMRAAEADAPGSGVKLRARVEAILGKLLDGRGWQV